MPDSRTYQGCGFSLVLDEVRRVLGDTAHPLKSCRLIKPFYRRRTTCDTSQEHPKQAEPQWWWWWIWLTEVHAKTQ